MIIKEESKMESRKIKYKWTLRKYIAIVSILTLQNTLILVNGEMDNMTGLVIITSFILYGFVLYQKK